MLVISRRRAWVLAVPIGRLVFASVALWVLCNSAGEWAGYLVYGALALLGLALAVDGFRWIRRVGETLCTWEPELWAPLAHRTLDASEARLVVRIIAGFRWASWKAELDPDPRVRQHPLSYRDICFADFPHYDWGKTLALRSARRVARALDLPPPDLEEAGHLRSRAVHRKKKKKKERKVVPPRGERGRAG